jgi:hypothetical protein
MHVSLTDTHPQCKPMHRKQQRIVIQHLLEVRNSPSSIDAVPVPTTPQMVEQATRSHAIQTVFDSHHSICRTIPNQPLQFHRMWEFGRPTEATVNRIVKFQRVQSGSHQRSGDYRPRIILRLTLPILRPQMLNHSLGIVEDILTFTVPSLAKHLDELLP